MSKVYSKVLPWSNKGDFRGPPLSSLVTVWAELSLLVQITLVPTGIVIVSGAYLKSAIFISITLAEAAAAVVVAGAAVVMAAIVAAAVVVVVAGVVIAAIVIAALVVIAVGVVTVGAVVIALIEVPGDITIAAVVGAAAGAGTVVAVLSPQAASNSDKSSTNPRKLYFLPGFIFVPSIVR